MRRNEINLTGVYAELTGDRRNLNPLVPVIASPGVALFYEHAENPVVRRQSAGARQRPSTGTWSHSGAWLRNIGLRFHGPAFDAFEAWAAAQGAPEHRPEILAVAFETAARLREWFDMIPDGTEQVVPDGMVAGDLRLCTFASREVVGDWVTRRGDQIAMDREKRARESQERLARETQRNEFGRVADRAKWLLESAGLEQPPKPGKDFYGVTDYTHAQIPIAVLSTILDEIEREGP